jgi:hypothetical protein
MGHHRQNVLSFLRGLLMTMALGAILLPLDVDGRIDFTQWVESSSA